MKKTIALLLSVVLILFTLSALADDWKCPACGHDSTNNFCSNCGASKPITNWLCTSCGLLADGKFCSNCGAAKESAVIKPSSEPSPTPSPTPSSTSAPVVLPVVAETTTSSDAQELIENAINHTMMPVKPSPNKYTWYILDYIGLNLSSIGYTSMGGDRFDRYGAGLLEICPIALDGSYVDIEEDSILANYVVVGQNIPANTEMKLTFKKDSKGNEYSNLIATQSIDSIDLLVARIDGTVSGDFVQYTPIIIKPSPDRYTCYVKNYIGKNLATVGYTSMGGDRLDGYLASHIELCLVTNDGTYIDIEDDDLLKQYIITGQNIEPNTEINLIYRKDSNGNEYDNLIDFSSISVIDLQVTRLDGKIYNEPISYDPISITLAPDKYTYYIKNYVGKNLASVGYTSLGGDRMDTYGSAYIELILVTPDRSVIDLENDEQLASYVVIAQDIAPNSKLSLTYRKDSKGNEYSNLIDTQNYNKITLTLKKVNPIPKIITKVETTDLHNTATVSTTKDYDGEVHTYRDFSYTIQPDNTVIITSYNGNSSTVTIPSDINGYEIGGIGASAFENHSEISSILMWADPLFIDTRSFMGCSSLKEISVPSSVTMIGDSAFEGCSKLKNVLLWGDPEIGVRTFYGCISLKEISIGSNTKLIGESAFEGCVSLASVFIWGGTNIGNNAFRGCTSLKEISIDSDTEYIGDFAFYGCTSLKSVIIWGSDTIIGNDAFANCPKLDKVTKW